MNGKIDSTDTLEFGFSSSGLTALDNDLNELLYDDICTELDNLETSVNELLDQCWQGVSKDRFVVDLGKRIEKIKEEIKVEYSDLKGRFEDLAEYYAKQDEELYTSMGN